MLVETFLPLDRRKLSHLQFWNPKRLPRTVLFLWHHQQTHGRRVRLSDFTGDTAFMLPPSVYSLEPRLRRIWRHR